jgi:hypothetical protein
MHAGSKEEKYQEEPKEICVEFYKNGNCFTYRREGESLP